MVARLKMWSPIRFLVRSSETRLPRRTAESSFSRPKLSAFPGGPPPRAALYSGIFGVEPNTVTACSLDRQSRGTRSVAVEARRPVNGRRGSRFDRGNQRASATRSSTIGVSIPAGNSFAGARSLSGLSTGLRPAATAFICSCMAITR